MLEVGLLPGLGFPAVTASTTSREFRFAAGLGGAVRVGAGSSGFLLRLSGGLAHPLPKFRGGRQLAGCVAQPLTLKCHRDPKILLSSDVWETLLGFRAKLETLPWGHPRGRPGAAPGAQWVLCTRVLTEFL